MKTISRVAETTGEVVSDGDEVIAPLVTVVTPCHDAAAFIGETIAAVREQTYPAVEHVVVDDASSDGSWEVIRRAVEHRQGPLRAHRLERNSGGSAARNIGAADARGEFLLFLDADDLIAPTAIEGLVQAARASDNAIVYCPWKRLRSIEGRWRLEPAEISLPEPGEDPLRGWLNGVWVPPCAVLWPRQVYETVGGWDEAVTYNDDGDLMMRAFAAGARLVRAEDGEAWYRSHGGERASMSTAASGPDRLQSAELVLEKLTDRLSAAGRLTEYADVLGGAYHRLALLAFQQGQRELGRKLTRVGDRYGGGRGVSRTMPGRLLARILGVERKEAVVAGLARLGIATRARKSAGRLLRSDDGSRGGRAGGAA